MKIRMLKMIKLIVCVLLCSVCCLNAHAQMFEWCGKPEYQDVEYLGSHLFKVKDKSGKWGVVNAETCKLKVECLYDSIAPLCEKVQKKDDRFALLLDATGSILKGVIREGGDIDRNFANYLEGKTVYIDASYPYFSRNYLVYKSKNKNGEWSWGLLSSMAKEVIAAETSEFKYVSPFTDQNFSVVQQFDGQYNISFAMKKNKKPELQLNDPALKNIVFMSTAVKKSGIALVRNGKNLEAKKYTINGGVVNLERIPHAGFQFSSNKGAVWNSKNRTVSETVAVFKHKSSEVFDTTFVYHLGEDLRYDGTENTEDEEAVAFNGHFIPFNNNGKWELDVDRKTLLPALYDDIECFWMAGQKNTKNIYDEAVIVTLSNGNKSLLRYNTDASIVLVTPETVNFTLKDSRSRYMEVKVKFQDFKNRNQGDVKLKVTRDGKSVVYTARSNEEVMADDFVETRHQEVCFQIPIQDPRSFETDMQFDYIVNDVLYTGETRHISCILPGDGVLPKPVQSVKDEPKIVPVPPKSVSYDVNLKIDNGGYSNRYGVATVRVTVLASSKMPPGSTIEVENSVATFQGNTATTSFKVEVSPKSGPNGNDFKSNVFVQESGKSKKKVTTIKYNVLHWRFKFH